MAIPNRQIGWSQESNLLWEISRQMDQLTKVTSQSGGGGSTNPTSTRIPVNVSGTFEDSFLKQSGDVLRTNYDGTNLGLFLDFSNNQFAINAGSFGQSSGLNMDLNNSNFSLGVSGYDADPFGLVIQGTNEIKLGDMNGAWNYQFIDMQSGVIKTSYEGNDFGIYLDFSTHTYTFGHSQNNQASIVVDNHDVDKEVIKTSYFGSDEGIYLDMGAQRYTFGAGSANFGIDVAGNRLTTSNSLFYTSAEAAANVGYLRVLVDGLGQLYIPVVSVA